MARSPHVRHPVCPDDDAVLCASVVEPALLALAPPDQARALLASLTPTQRVTQAVAQAAFLVHTGAAATPAALLAAWDAMA